MIKNTFNEAFSQDWVDKNIVDPTNELVLFRKIIPWEKLVKQLSQFYSKKKGCVGRSIRLVVAILILAKLRRLSDQKVIEQIRENRYCQYFCNVPDEEIFVFLNSSSLTRIRQRYGKKGAEIIEKNIFNKLRKAGIIDPEYALIDSSVLESNIVYPTDVKLVYKALSKIYLFAQHHNLNLWWDHDEIKAIWREFSLNKEQNAWDYLFEFSEVLKCALFGLEIHIQNLKVSEKVKKRAEQLLGILILLDHQNDLKIKGVKHIDNRIVSLDEIDARPIKKGKKHPDCEFGTTFQATFNRQGFMITVENFIGKPNDKKLYPEAIELFKKRMKAYPDKAVTDLGYRSNKNLAHSKGKARHTFMGRSEDVPEEIRTACQKARSATEGFIAVIKHWRGMKRCLYKGFSGDQIWSLLCQAAHNLKKFLQLYRNEELSEESLIKLRLLS
jgi:IS5 family transposase